MCRFLALQSEMPIDPAAWLQDFARMAERSHALDGDWQGDGWGVAWLDEAGSWQVITSLAPIWQDTERFRQVPMARLLMVHARSASFPTDKGDVSFNQPYIAGNYAFVFNGLLRGVKLPGIPGRIGAEKIWSLLQRELQEHPPQTALERVRQTLLENSREVVALNVALSDGANIYALNQFDHHPEYYQLYVAQEGGLKAVCSEPLVAGTWHTVERSVITLQGR